MCVSVLVCALRAMNMNRVMIVIMVVCMIGVFSVKASSFELAVMAVAGIVGYALRKFRYDVAPLLLAMVIGDRMEVGFRRALTISEGDYAIFTQGAAVQLFLGILVVVACLQIGAKLLGYRR